MTFVAMTTLNPRLPEALKTYSILSQSIQFVIKC